MAGNSEIIDSVVDPVAIEQFNELKAAAASVTEQMVIATKAAINLNNATGGSQSFSVFKRNAEQANIAIGSIIGNSEKLKVAEDKARAYKADMDEKAMNKYLVLMSKQQAAQEAQDAKDIAAAELKASKLADIQDKAAAKQQAINDRKANVQFQPQDPANPHGLLNPDITREPDQPAVRYEPLITGNENLSTSAKAATTSITEETEALTEQEAVLQAVSGSYKENISLLLSLQAEQAAVKAEMKGLNTETAVGQERQIALTAEQLRLKTAIQQTSTTLSQQTKEQLAVETSATQLDASLLRLRGAYNSLSVAERENEAVGGVLLAEINLLDAKSKELALTQGVTTKEVGAYEKAIAKATNASQLAATGINVLTRSLVRMVVQFALFGVAFEAIQALYEYIKALNIFNPVATEAEMRQKALVDAFNSSDYSKAIESVEKLEANIDLAKKGFADSDSVINEYNQTIGKTTGFVDTLNEAQQGFIDHSADFIRAAYLEAAAQAVLADASKFAAETAVKNQKLRNEIEDENSGKITLAIVSKTNFTTDDVEDGLAKRDQKQIDENNKREKENYANSLKTIEGFYKDKNAILQKYGTEGAGNSGHDAIAELRNQVANEPLERQKIVAQNIISNDKQSYTDRLKAVHDYYAAARGIADNNEKLATNGIKLSADQKLKIEQEYSNTILQLEINRDNQTRDLNYKRYKQEQEILKNNLQAQKDAFKSVLDDPNQSYSVKLAALGAYNDRSMALIKSNYSEQLKEAGNNSQSKKIARQNEEKSELELTNEIANERIKIEKEVNEKLAKNFEDLQKANEAQAKNRIAALSEIRDTEVQAIDDQKSKEIAALDKKYSAGKIAEKKYQQDLRAIQDQANIDRLGAEVFYQQKVLEIKQAAEDADVAFAKGNGATPDQIAAIKSKSGVSQQKTVVQKAGQALSNAIDTQANDEAKAADEKRKEIEKQAIESAKEMYKAIEDYVNKAYENQIALLEQKKQLIDDTATSEKAAVQNSILSSADKARKEAVIDAQAQQQKLQIDAQERKIKTAQAKFDRDAAIAGIIENTALAVTKVLYNPILVALVAAAGAVELAAAIATPIPKFAKGGTASGLAIWGEAGRELAIEQSGKSYLSPNGATLANFPSGTKIIPNHMIRPDKLNYSGGEQVPWKQVIAAINRNKPVEQKRPIVRVNVNNDAYYNKFYR